MTTWRVLYHSRSATDADIAVSGLVFTPNTVAPDAPVLAYAHGTVGIGDQCAPSKTLGQGEAAHWAGEYVTRGFVVTATDYEGLGTPGTHTYLVGQSEGRAVLDSIRAARTLTGADRGPAIVFGHSQGGGAAIFAAELTHDYAPDVHLVGAIAAAPAGELKSAYPLLRGSPYFGYLFMIAAGLHAAYPGVDLHQFLTPTGVAAATDAAGACAETIQKFQNTNVDDYITVDPATIEPTATLLEDNTPGNLATTMPVLIVHGEQDEQVPVQISQLMLQRMCTHPGSSVLRRTYPGATHESVLGSSVSDIRSWIDDRLAHKPAPSTACADAANPVIAPAQPAPTPATQTFLAIQSPWLGTLGHLLATLTAQPRSLPDIQAAATDAQNANNTLIGLLRSTTWPTNEITTDANALADDLQQLTPALTDGAHAPDLTAVDTLRDKAMDPYLTALTAENTLRLALALPVRLQ